MPIMGDESCENNCSKEVSCELCSFLKLLGWIVVLFLPILVVFEFIFSILLSG